MFTVVSTPEIDRAVRAIIDQARDDEGNASDWGIRRGEIYRMINSPNQLREKMKFFLHELYIASYTAADGDAIFFQEYIDLLRSHAFGNVIALSQAVSNSGLMLRYLDGETNVAGSVNENYARELMELFALGVGHYTERDVNEAARALTGWTLVWNQNTQRNYVAFRAADHDTGVKNLFEGTAWAQSGNFNMQDIVRIVYAHPQAPRYLARRLLEFFVGGRFQEQHIEALAATILANDWQLAPTVRTLLSSELFYSPGAIKSKLKTPLEHSIGLSLIHI